MNIRHNLYKNIGTGLIIVSIYSLIFGAFKFLVSLLFTPGFYSTLLDTALLGSKYNFVLFYFFMVVSTLISIWGIRLSLKLIKTNHYSKQILYFVLTYAIIKILYFILYAPVSRFFALQLLEGILLIFFGLYADNAFSKIVKGKF